MWNIPDLTVTVGLGYYCFFFVGVCSVEADAIEASLFAGNKDASLCKI